MKKSNFASVNSYSPPSRGTLSISGFRGMDCTSPQTSVSENRAVYANNYAFIDGLAQKRWAYEQIGQAPDVYFTEMLDDGSISSKKTLNGKSVNGIWELTMDDRNRHVIAHIGSLLFEVEGLGEGNARFKPIYTKIGSAQDCSIAYQDRRSQAFIGQHRLWFLSGKRLMMAYWDNGSIKCEPVSESDYAFVPTTTISITYADAKTHGRTGLDNPNMMSRFRKNLLLSGVGKDPNSAGMSKYYEYPLDSALVWKEEGKDMSKSYVKIRTIGRMEE